MLGGILNYFKSLKWKDIIDKPDALKNPESLKFSGESNAEYDGSKSITVDIPKISKGTLKSLQPDRTNLWVDYIDNNHIRNAEDGAPSIESDTCLCSGFILIPNNDVDYYISSCKAREQPFFFFFDIKKSFLSSVKIGADIPGHTDKTGYCILSKDDIPQEAVYVAINADYGSRYFGRDIPDMDNIAIRYANDGIPHISTDIIDTSNPEDDFYFFLNLPDGMYFLDGKYEGMRIGIDPRRYVSVSGLVTVKHENSDQNEKTILSFVSSGLVCVSDYNTQEFSRTNKLYTSSGWAKKENLGISFDDE